MLLALTKLECIFYTVPCAFWSPLHRKSKKIRPPLNCNFVEEQHKTFLVKQTIYPCYMEEIYTPMKAVIAAYLGSASKKLK